MLDATKFLQKNIYVMCMSVLLESMSVHHMWTSEEGIRPVVSHHICDGNETWVLCKNKCS